MTVLDLWSEQLIRFLLVLGRVGGIFSVAPIFGQAKVPVQVRIIIIVALAAAVAPVSGSAPQFTQASPLPLVVGLAREVTVGLAIGFIASLVISAAQMAGELMDYEIGFGLSGSVDPISNVQMPVAARFLQMFATLLFLVVGAHHLLIQGLVESFGIIAPGAPANLAAASRPVMEIFVEVFLTGLKIAGPIIGLMLLCDIALGLVARTSPQLNLLMVGLPLKIGVGICALAVGLPVMGVVLTHLLRGMYGDVMVAARALGH
ncbi:MAG: flagellar biosynthetic protein FliR [Armatimonadetes bacterium]|nr:flagellar biosynthetic protein FliR [Armatimonadota bacterium]